MVVFELRSVGKAVMSKYAGMSFESNVLSQPCVYVTTSKSLPSSDECRI